MSAVAPIVASQRQANGSWVAVVPSPSGTVLPAGSTAKITDAAGNLWTLPITGIASVNGVPDLSTWGVTQLAYVDGIMWQFNSTNWYSKAVPLWSAPTTVSPITTGSAVLSWTPPTKNTDGTPVTGLTGYVISYGQGALTSTVKVGLVSSYTLSLAAGTWNFEIAAANSFNVNSAPSAVVSKII